MKNIFIAWSLMLTCSAIVCMAPEKPIFADSREEQLYHKKKKALKKLHALFDPILEFIESDQATHRDLDFLLTVLPQIRGTIHKKFWIDKKIPSEQE